LPAEGDFQGAREVGALDPAESTDDSLNGQLRPAYPTGTPKTTTFEAFKVKASKGYPVAKKIFWYMNTAGEAMFAIIRFEEAQSIFEPGAKPAKTFRPLTLWRMEDGALKWSFKAAPKPWPLWNLPALRANPDAPVCVCEGEKSAAAASVVFPRYIGVTPAGGAKSPGNTNWSPLRDREVVVCPDRDSAGKKFGRLVRNFCKSAGANVRIDVGLYPAGCNDLADVLKLKEEGKL
jgi:hypothetical protein